MGLPPSLPPHPLGRPLQTSHGFSLPRVLPPSLAVIHCFPFLPSSHLCLSRLQQVSPYSPCLKPCSLGIPSVAGSRFLDRSEQRPRWLGPRRSCLSSTWREGSGGSLKSQHSLPACTQGWTWGLPPPPPTAAVWPSLPLHSLFFPHGFAAPQLEHQLRKAQTLSVSAISVSPAARAMPAT